MNAVGKDLHLTWYDDLILVRIATALIYCCSLIPPTLRVYLFRHHSTVKEDSFMLVISDDSAGKDLNLTTFPLVATDLFCLHTLPRQLFVPSKHLPIPPPQIIMAFSLSVIIPSSQKKTYPYISSLNKLYCPLQLCFPSSIHQLNTLSPSAHAPRCSFPSASRMSHIF